jgi:hypothetical protein
LQGADRIVMRCSRCLHETAHIEKRVNHALVYLQFHYGTFTLQTFGVSNTFIQQRVIFSNSNPGGCQVLSASSLLRPLKRGKTPV